MKPGSVVICQCDTDGLEPLGIEFWLKPVGDSGDPVTYCMKKKYLDSVTEN